MRPKHSTVLGSIAATGGACPPAHLLVLAGLAACSGPTELSLLVSEMPAEIEWLAVLIQAEGQVASATGLVSRKENVTFALSPILGGGSTVVLLGFEANQFAKVTLPDLEALRSNPLHASQDGSSLLPRPRWVGTGSIDGSSAEIGEAPKESVGLPALSADWLPPNMCGEAEVGFSARLGCQRCGGFGWKEQCAVHIEAPASLCGSELALEASLDVEGEPRFGGAGTSDCRFLGKEDGRAVFDCGGVTVGERCRVELNHRVERAWFDVERTQFFSPPQETAELNKNDGVHRLGGGYALTMTILRDRVVVADLGGHFDSFRCNGEAPGQLSFFDLDTLDPVGTATAPACLTAMVQDPGNPGFIGYSGGSSPGQYLHRFGPDGEVLRAVGPVEIEKRHWAHQLLPLPDLGLLAVALAGRENAREEAGLVMLHDLTTFEPRATSVPLGAHVFNVQRSSQGDTLRVLTGTGDTIHTLALPSADLLSSVRLRGPCEAKVLKPNHMTLGPTGRALFTAKEPPLVGELNFEDETCRSDYFGDLPAAPVPLIPWPGDPDRMLVGLVGTLENRPALIGSYRVESARFDPGSQTIGTGSLISLQSDERGRIYALLAEEGVLVRLTPR